MTPYMAESPSEIDEQDLKSLMERPITRESEAKRPKQDAAEVFEHNLKMLRDELRLIGRRPPEPNITACTFPYCELCGLNAGRPQLTHTNGLFHFCVDCLCLQCGECQEHPVDCDH